jgi:hypothetical protein
MRKLLFRDFILGNVYWVTPRWSLGVGKRGFDMIIRLRHNTRGFGSWEEVSSYLEIGPDLFSETLEISDSGEVIPEARVRPARDRVAVIHMILRYMLALHFLSSLFTSRILKEIFFCCSA